MKVERRPSPYWRNSRNLCFVECDDLYSGRCYRRFGTTDTAHVQSRKQVETSETSWTGEGGKFDSCNENVISVLFELLFQLSLGKSRFHVDVLISQTYSVCNRVFWQVLVDTSKEPPGVTFRLEGIFNFILRRWRHCVPPKFWQLPLRCHTSEDHSLCEITVHNLWA